LVPYSLLATLVVAGHLAFIVFVVAGGLLVRRWPRLAWLHLPCAAWGVYVEWSGRICPLTPIENWLRRRAGVAGYAEGFIEHYLLAIVYPEGLTPVTQAAAAVLVVGINAVVYAQLFRRPRQR
jgi:hypothetical protein